MDIFLLTGLLKANCDLKKSHCVGLPHLGLRQLGEVGPNYMWRNGGPVGSDGTSRMTGTLVKNERGYIAWGCAVLHRTDMYSDLVAPVAGLGLTNPCIGHCRGTEIHAGPTRIAAGSGYAACWTSACAAATCMGGLWDWDHPRCTSLHRVLLLSLCHPLFWGGGTRMAAVAVAVTTVWAAATLGLATAVVAMGAAYWRLVVCVANKCLTMSSELQFKLESVEMRFAGWILDSFRFSQFKKLANNWVLTLLLACSTRLPTVAKMCEKCYPAAEGWVIRVYHDFEATDPNFRSVMCKASCEFANIDFCYVKSLQAPLDSYASPSGMWGTSKLSQLAKNVNWEEIESKMLKQIGANPVIRSMKGLDQVIIGSVVYPAVCKTPLDRSLKSLSEPIKSTEIMS
ncbi:unnamed protein product [Notodromas monacha]|uniref:Uncharacterized protein n=1 Tax=Notodromas monacha TaxID=399045 RepID=A0A7R9C2B6_9CRUS|nr:unnamed protein product [Notodromas monacha]CAG0924804.1 unnamed protein product [Notodromas monacha]